VKVTDGVRGLFHLVLAVGEKLDKLTLGELQEHEFRSLAFRLCVKNFFRAEGISIPADAALYIRHFKGDMSEANSGHTHSSAPFGAARRTLAEANSKPA
jgi:hypothetical protein